MASSRASDSGDEVEALAESPVMMPSSAGAGTVDDSRLVDAARQGDRSAFGELYDRYARIVHGILLARVPYSEVDDLVHDAFLQALRRLHTLRDPARFGPWLAAIARNRANDYYRHAVDEVELPENLSAGDAEQAESKAAGIPSDVDAAFLLGVIRKLPETYREPLLLRLVEGMTGPEIAARTGLTPGSVRVNLHRGMQQLRERLARMSRAPKSGAP
jgi:RNA polymerase sigma-70 factor, ECF subfamily